MRPILHSYAALLSLLFIALKLTNQIDWSWLWVLSPLWLPIVLFAAIGCIFGCIAIVIYLVERIMETCQPKN